MYIKISNLNEGVHNFSFDESISKIGLEEPFFGNFNAEFELSKSHHQIILKVEVQTNAHFQCDRCGKDYETKLYQNYTVIYLFGPKPEGDLPENVIYLPFESDRIYVGNDLRDFALLSIPMKKVCLEDCKGLCFNCGKDLNEGSCDCEGHAIDTRWLPLMELKNKLNKN